jgi:membrane-associated phospholipid phosphatase
VPVRDVRAVSWRGAVGRLLLALTAGWSVVLGVMVLSGVLITQVVAGTWPLTHEDGVVRALVSLRSPFGDDATWVGSRLGDTWAVVGACAVAVLVLRRLLHRWREAVFVAACTIGQSTVFLLTTLMIDRSRPDVPKLDAAPPTSSFPSGHAGASLVLCLALAVVVHRRVRNTWVRRGVIVVLLIVPAVVAFSRLYRGMHVPTDIAGSVLNAGLVLLVTAWVLGRTALPDDGRAARRR